MELIELLDVLASRGVQIWAEGDRLRCRAPQGALTADVRAALEANKPAILASLRAMTSANGAQQRLWSLRQPSRTFP